MPEQQARYNRQIALWLLFCAGVILAMILLGGVTRLTHSGLSMVEWRPLIGIIPPLNEEQWQQVFSQYQHFPEYQQVNSAMSLSEFKSIFMFEYLHRVLGRLIGVVFLLPFLFFYFSKRIPAGLSPKLLVMFVLGGLQGLLGWYMVKSGLVDNPRVSQYRLTAHLGAAVIIYGYILWIAFDLLASQGRARQAISCAVVKLKPYALMLSGLIFVMILSGGFVAGTRAGLIYPSFPLMGDSLIPAGLYSMTPAWLSAFEDLTTIQFNHRLLAYSLFVLIMGFIYLALGRGVSGRLKWVVYGFAAMLLVQLSLGISTLLLHVPVLLASLHQGGAVSLFTLSLYVSHSLRVKSA